MSMEKNRVSYEPSKAFSRPTRLAFDGKRKASVSSEAQLKDLKTNLNEAVPVCNRLGQRRSAKTIAEGNFELTEVENLPLSVLLDEVN